MSNKDQTTRISNLGKFINNVKDILNKETKELIDKNIDELINDINKINEIKQKSSYIY